MVKNTYFAIFRGKWSTDGCNSMDDFIERFHQLNLQFIEWKEHGIFLEEGSVGDDYATFITHDPEIAAKFGFQLMKYDLEDE